MAEILIKNLEMPNGCYECPLGKHEERSYYYECNASDGVNLDWHTIPAYCPLVEVPTHGDLKDADSIRKKMVDKYERRKRTWDPFYAEGFLYAIDMLDKAPIILEATK